MVSSKQLNWFPTKGGVSKYLTPHVIMYDHNMDFNKNCQIPIGAQVQVAKDNSTTNTNAPRKINSIYLQTLYKNKDNTYSCIYRLVKLLQAII